VYQFEIHPRKLTRALDMFAQFFVSPLFARDAVSREVRAVHSEFKETCQSEYSRGMDVVTETCDPAHPLSIFGWGNIDSLERDPVAKGLVTRDALLEFHAKHYSANHMKLVRSLTRYMQFHWIFSYRMAMSPLITLPHVSAVLHRSLSSTHLLTHRHLTRLLPPFSLILLRFLSSPSRRRRSPWRLRCRSLSWSTRVRRTRSRVPARDICCAWCPCAISTRSR
jgi:hypothetical protein